MNHRTQLLLLLIFCFSIVLTAQDQPILRLNTGMHSTRIKRLDVDPVTNNILTISADKTAKLWDTKGRLLQTYRPYIGMGDEGMLFAGAVCPNKDQIAVGGWTKNTGKTHCAYIFSKSSGEIIKKICGLPNVIQDIEYSPDGRFLVLTMGGANGMRAYRTSTFSMVSQDKYGDNTYCAVFDPNGRLAT
ncbi:MAG: WD40 repeat domain-containing protein, partial [Bacteroidota bacterium]